MMKKGFGATQSVVKGGFVEIDGPISPQGMTIDALRQQADENLTLELRLEDGRWLDIQFKSTTGNRVRGVRGPRAER